MLLNANREEINMWKIMQRILFQDILPRIAINSRIFIVAQSIPESYKIELCVFHFKFNGMMSEKKKEFPEMKAGVGCDVMCEMEIRTN